jgi:hypothetical protein
MQANQHTLDNRTCDEIEVFQAGEHFRTQQVAGSGLAGL